MFSASFLIVGVLWLQGILTNINIDLLIRCILDIFFLEMILLY